MYWPSRFALLINFMLFCLVCTIGVSIADTKIGTGVFPNPQNIDDKLIRGNSTRSDVIKLLGVPNGAGGALLPGFGERSEVLGHYSVWYYEDIELEDSKSENKIIIMDMRHQILMIFFKEDRYYGYFWTSTRNDFKVQ